MRGIFAAELPSLPKAVERMMTWLSKANFTSRLLALGCALFVSVTSCASNGDNEVTDMSEAPLVHLLAEGEVVFGIFSRSYDVDLATDFLFYSLESGPFDIPGMHAFVQSKRDSAGGAETHPLVLRIPPIRDGHDAARDYVQQGLAAGAVSIVFPHVETVEEAELAVSAMGSGSWPGNASGSLVNMLLIEDQVGVRKHGGCRDRDSNRVGGVQRVRCGVRNHGRCRRHCGAAGARVPRDHRDRGSGVGGGNGGRGAAYGMINSYICTYSTSSSSSHETSTKSSPMCIMRALIGVSTSPR